MKRILILAILISLVFLNLGHAAEYLGEDLDGNTYSCTAFSYGTSKYYYVNVEFSGSEATLYFSNGNHVVLELDDEEIDDPSSISAFDYQRSIYWDLDVDI